MPIARQLTSAIIQDAKVVGYTCMLLDTLSSLASVIKHYESIGSTGLAPTTIVL
ncbi:MAG: hypothetical protein FWG10_11120 [Eubacteriaceae bacterium]|nr:hypothetical protein [Eubacteriaceae bacterium]